MLRRRVAQSDERNLRLEALADAAAERFSEQSGVLSEEIGLLRQRVTDSHAREQVLQDEARITGARFAERGNLLQEVNHRAKNSIQIAMAMLNLQRRASSEPQVRLALASAVERLSHVARVHSMLYEHSPDQQTIDFGGYLTTFCAELRQALADEVEVRCSADEVKLDTPRAINLALITSEAVTNALKHAFPEGRPGTISVDFGRHSRGARLAVQDTGIGMKDNRREDTMGLKLIRTLVKGIDGKLRIDSPEGTRLQVVFPL